jgi:hypothetical protein
MYVRRHIHTYVRVLLYDRHAHAHMHARVRTLDLVSSVRCSISSKISRNILSALSQAQTHHQENTHMSEYVC